MPKEGESKLYTKGGITVEIGSSNTTLSYMNIVDINQAMVDSHPMANTIKKKTIENPLYGLSESGEIKLSSGLRVRYDPIKGEWVSTMKSLEDPFYVKKKSGWSKYNPVSLVKGVLDEIFKDPMGQFKKQMESINKDINKLRDEYEDKSYDLEQMQIEAKDEIYQSEKDILYEQLKAQNNLNNTAIEITTNIQQNIIDYQQATDDKLFRFNIILPEIFGIALANRQTKDIEAYVEDQKDIAKTEIKGVQDSITQSLNDMMNIHKNLINEWENKIKNSYEDLLLIENQIQQLDVLATITTTNFWNHKATAFDHMITSSGFIGKLVGGFVKIITGLVRDIVNVVTKFDLEALGRIVVTVLKVAVVVASINNPALFTLLVADLIIYLDSTYAYNSILSGVLQILDVILNDILRIDEIWSATKVLDPNHENHMELIGYVRMGIAITATISTIATFTFNPEFASNLEFVSELGTGIVKESIGIISSTIPLAGNLSSIYSTISTMISSLKSLLSINIFNSNIGLGQLWDIAQNIMKIVRAIRYKSKLPNMPDHTTYPELSEAEIRVEQIKDVISSKLSKAKEKVTFKYVDETRRRMLAHMKDMKEFMSDTDEIINEFLLQVIGDTAGYLDPEGLIVKNTRYSYIPNVAFGYENMFNESKFAGSESYTKDMLYKSYDL